MPFATRPKKLNLTPLLFFFVSLSLSISAQGQEERHRMVILADMGNEHDEMQQMAHMLVNCNEFDLEALIAVSGKYLHPGAKIAYRQKLHPELFHQLIDGYEKVRPNLQEHARGWPKATDLRSIVYEGQKGYGIADVGEGKASAGSHAIARALQKNDKRPLWVVVNAGSNTLAQTLIDLEKAEQPERFRKMLDKLRIFENGAQDNAGAWLCARYPSLHWIRSNYQTYAYGGPRGKNMGPHYWKPYPYSPKGQHDWLREHVQEEHGALGDLYPDRLFGKERFGFMEGGGTIPWLGLVNRGLFDINEPSWGGWSGRFSREKKPEVWSRHESVKVDEVKGGEFRVFTGVSDTWVDPQDGKTWEGESVPVWRWRKAMYTNLQCRMDWCVMPFEDANHHPVAIINDDASNRILRISATPQESLQFDASKSSDIDGNELKFRWWIYQEAGTYPKKITLNESEASEIEFRVPDDAAGKQIHLILEVDDTHPQLSLVDYRRVVIEVKK